MIRISLHHFSGANINDLSHRLGICNWSESQKRSSKIPKGFSVERCKHNDHVRHDAIVGYRAFTCVKWEASSNDLCCMSRGKKFAEKRAETRFLSSRNRHLQQHFEHYSIWTLQAWTAVAWRRVMQHSRRLELPTNMLHWSSLLSLYASLQEEWTTSVTCLNFPARFVPSRFTTPLNSPELFAEVHSMETVLSLPPIQHLSFHL